MTETDPQRLLRLAEERRAGITPEQEERRAWVDRRAKAIQAVGPRPVDGVTFGAKPGEKRGRAAGSAG